MADQVFAVNSGFYDAVNSDRTYSADDMNRPYKRVVSNGVFATPQGTKSTDLQVVSANNGMQIIVQKGEGIFADKWFENPAAINVTVPANTSTVPRIDSVIVQVDKRTSGRVGNIVYRTGTPSVNPVAPSINTVSNVIEYRLANVRVETGTTAITTAMITDRRGSSDCPWVTSLIYQVDTSVLYDQWAAAYEEYFEAEKEMWDDWYSHLTEELDVSMSMVKHTNTFVTTSETSEVMIGISDYNADTDLLEVYINGMRAIEGSQYTINGNTSIILSAPLGVGQTVNFVALKSVLIGNADEITSAIQALEERIGSIQGGNPTVVDTVSAMTDTDKIYILSTDRKWYYYNLSSSAWVAGGVYGGVPTDTTLTQSGVAADAKVVGRKIKSLNDAVDVMDERVDSIVGQTGNSNTEIVDARQDALGVVHSTLRARLLTDYHNITDLPDNTNLFAERVLQYDYPYEHTLNGFCCDDDYFYVTSVARNTIPADFEKTKILKFSRSTYELVAEIEGDYGHANSLTVDRTNHVLYSAKCFYYEVDSEDVVQSMRSNDINVFDVSGSSITYVKTISTDYRSGSVAFWNGTLYMYYEEGAIFAIDTDTGAATPYCTLSDTGTGTAQQSIDIDDNFIYRLTSTDSSIAYSGGILVYDHQGKFINRVAISNKFRVGFVDELEDLTVEDGVVYVASCQTDRSEPAPYNNMRNVLVQKIYMTNALPNLNVLDGRFLANNPSYRAPINLYVDGNTTKYKADGTSTYPFKKIRDALFYTQFCDKGRYFVYVRGGRYSETLKFVNMAGVDVRIQRWGNDAVILDKPITMFDGIIEFRQITFDVTNNPNGTLVCDASWNSEPLRLSLRNCNFIADTLITGTHYGIYNSKIFGATIHIVSDTYDTNSSGIIHYAPYCRTELWQRPNDRVNKDIFRINSGSLIHSRIELSASTRLDSIYNPGIYMIAGDSVGDLPSGTNGWLIVLSQPLYGDAYNTLTKQIFFRMGTAGKTDNHVFFRTYGGSVWGQWYEFALKEGSMPSGTTLTFGYGNFTGYTTSSKKELTFIIPLNFEVPSNLTNIRFVTANITVRNNGVAVSSIGLEDTSKITSYTIQKVNGIGVKATLNFDADFVTNNFGSMLNNNVVNVLFQSANSGLVFTDPNAQPDTPDVPDDDGQDPVDSNS